MLSAVKTVPGHVSAKDVYNAIIAADDLGHAYKKGGGHNGAKWGT